MAKQKHDSGRKKQDQRKAAKAADGRGKTGKRANSKDRKK